MEGSNQRSRANSNVKASISTEKKLSRKPLVASEVKPISHKSLNRIASFNRVKLGKVNVGQLATFLLEIAALEIVRRISKAKCPFIWSSLQTLQILCYPPFKWIEKWTPFRALIKGMQKLSRPLLVISVATAISEQLYSKESISNNDSDSSTDTRQVESNAEPSTTDSRVDETPQSVSANWLFRLYTELENQGISLPERLNEEELHRFYTAANGDFPCFISAVKKTIRWRETYYILCGPELEQWSNVVFWHGSDVNNRPCLIVRLGLASSALPTTDRPRIAQAIVSQVEYGVLHLVNSEHPQITVLVDCEGLSPLKIPMQVLRSCTVLLQDNFPDRLACLFVIRLPPVLRVVAQTYITIVKDATRKKMKIAGGLYKDFLYEYLQTLPDYLGGTCTCTTCNKISTQNTNLEHTRIGNNNNRILPSPPSPSFEIEDTDTDLDVPNYDKFLRTVVIGILIFWAFVALMAGIHDPESRPVLPS
jgi:hypothetical protein